MTPIEFIIKYKELLSISAVAEACGIPTQTMHKAISGDRTLSDERNAVLRDFINSNFKETVAIRSSIKGIIDITKYTRLPNGQYQHKQSGETIVVRFIDGHFHSV